MSGKALEILCSLACEQIVSSDDVVNSAFGLSDENVFIISDFAQLKYNELVDVESTFRESLWDAVFQALPKGQLPLVDRMPPEQMLVFCDFMEDFAEVFAKAVKRPETEASPLIITLLLIRMKIFQVDNFSSRLSRSCLPPFLSLSVLVAELTGSLKSAAAAVAEKIGPRGLQVADSLMPQLLQVVNNLIAELPSKDYSTPLIRMIDNQHT